MAEQKTPGTKSADKIDKSAQTTPRPEQGQSRDSVEKRVTKTPKTVTKG